MFRQALRQWQESIKSQWAAGQFANISMEETALANHKAISEYKTISSIIDLDAEQIQGIFENDSEA